MLASFPSPPVNTIELGPLNLNIYGLMIALGVVAAVWLFGRRLEEREVGTRDDASAIAVWAVLAGVIGARLYHVATDIEKFYGNWGEVVAIWNGGLGIPGGLLLGAVVGMYMARRRGIGIAVAATCAAPAVPLAQAIGRWGNYFNQELYGRPTNLPWAVRIDADNLEPGFAVGTTFHPTFLYESLWCLGLCLVLLWIDRRWRPAPGQLFAMYVMGYGIGRFWVEGMRIDEADHVAGLRFNQWVALAMIVGGGVAMILLRMYPVAEPVVGPSFDDSFDDRIDTGADEVPDNLRDDVLDEVPDDVRDEGVSPAVDPIPSRTDGPTPASE
jgi:phosphatidylglycerol---prolipoprotein diacylglyceryl transferase